MATKRSLSKLLGSALIGGIVAALLVMSVLTVYGGLREAIKIQTGEWNSTSGQVLTAREHYKRRSGKVQVVEYEYRVKRRTYRGYHASLVSKKKYAPGQGLLIYYDQKHPFRSYAEEHPRKGLREAVILSVIGLVLFIPSGVLGFLCLMSMLPAAMVDRVLTLVIQLFISTMGLFAWLSIKKKRLLSAFSVADDPGGEPRTAERGRKRVLEGEKDLADLDQALTRCTKAIELDPTVADGYFRRAEVRIRKDDYEGAIADYTEALSLDHCMATAYRGRAWVHNERGEFDRAKADYDEAIRVDSMDASSYEARAEFWEALGEHGRAIVDYTDAIRLDPKNSLHYFFRGQLYLKTGQYREAVADLNKRINQDRNDSEAYAHRAEAYRKLGEFEQAHRDDERMRQLHAE